MAVKIAPGAERNLLAHYKLDNEYPGLPYSNDMWPVGFDENQDELSNALTERTRIAVRPAAKVQ